MKELTVRELFCGYDGIDIPTEVQETQIMNITVHPSEVDKGSLLFITEKVGGGAPELDADTIKQTPTAIVISEHHSIKSPRCPVIYANNVRQSLAYALSHAYGIDYNRMKVIGVTGTNGKTTTATLIYNILKGCGYRAGFIGTGKIISDSKLLSESTYSMTTPDPTTLYPILAQMSQDRCEYVVMEVSSHSLALGKVSPIKFEYGIFTNLDNDHMDFHKNKDEYFRTKVKLFEQCKRGLFNLDDEYARRAKDLCSCEKSTYGILRCGDAYASEIEMQLGQSSFFYREKNLIFKATSHLPGAFNVYNAMAAIKCTIDLGIKPCVVKRELEKVDRVDGRMEIIPGVLTAIIDYAHTPDAFRNCLKSIKSNINNRQKLTVVFGCGGDRDKQKRPFFGEYAEMYADRIVITEDNCRSESFDSIVADITMNMSKNKHVVIRDREEAIRYAFKHSLPDDVVALIGKGHEKYKITNGEYTPFDERKIVDELLAELEGSYAYTSGYTVPH